MFLELDSHALQDANEIADWYALDDVDVAQRFNRELDRVLRQLPLLPNRWPRGDLETRRATLKAFPYVIIYRVLPDRVVVIAIGHQKRDPDFWLERIKPPSL